MIEWAVTKQLQGLLDEASALRSLSIQFPARTGTKTTLVVLADNLHLHLNAGSMVLLILLDLFVDFDTVDHLVLVKCLASFLQGPPEGHHG